MLPRGFSGGSDGKESACKAGELDSIGNGNLPQYSCLGNPMDRAACQGYSPRVCKELDMTERATEHSRILS